MPKILRGQAEEAGIRRLGGSNRDDDRISDPAVEEALQRAIQKAKTYGELKNVSLESLNRPVFKLDDDHPAKQFLQSFIDCKADCVGRHHGLGGSPPIDQEWRSATDGRVWTFSDFAYAFISTNFELDGFLENTPYLTPEELNARREIPLLRTMMHECSQAAQQAGNAEIVELTNQVLHMLDLWDKYIAFRGRMIVQALN